VLDSHRPSVSIAFHRRELRPGDRRLRVLG